MRSATFLATRGPLGTTDSAFSAELFAETYNADLANTFGNSASRVTNMIGKYFGGVLPEAGTSLAVEMDEASVVDQATGEAGSVIFAKSFGKIALERAAEGGLFVVKQVDGYIEAPAPFTIAKEPERMGEVGTILYNCAEALRVASVLLWPFIPDACEAFWERIGCDYAEQMKLDGGKGKLDEWVVWGQLKAGTGIEKGGALFPRYVADKS